MKKLILLLALLLPSQAFAQGFGNLYINKASQVRTNNGSFGKFLPTSATTVQSALDYINSYAGSSSGASSQWLTSPNVGIGTYDNVGIGTVTPTTTLTIKGSVADFGIDLNGNVTAGGIDSFAKLMLHNDGSNGSSTFTDSSITPHTMTANSGATISTAQSVFGGASGLFVRASTQSVTTPDNADLDLGANDFTIAMRVRLVSTPAFMSLMNQFGAAANRGWDFLTDGNVLRFDYSTDGTASTTLTSAWTPSLNTWYSVEVDRSGNNLYLFVDGIQIGTTKDVTGVTVFNSTQAVALGGDGASATGDSLDGYIDELRFDIGIARHTSNYAVAGSAFSGNINQPRIKFQDMGVQKWNITMDGNNSDNLTISNGTVGTNDRISVTTGGNVGIGSISPGNPLEVQGAFRQCNNGACGTLHGVIQSGVYYPTFDARDSDGSKILVFRNMYVISDTATDEQINFFSNDLNQNAYIGQNDSNGHFYIVSGNNVGIGTISAGKFLDVSGDERIVGTNSLFLGSDNAISLKASAASSGDLQFSTNSTASMALTNGGNLGVGTTKPLTTLSVYGNVGIGTQTASGGSLIVVGVGNIGLGTINPQNKVSIGGSAAVGAAYSTVAAPANGLTVQGNTAIGTFTTTSMLQVTGTAGNNATTFTNATATANGGSAGGWTFTPGAGGSGSGVQGGAGSVFTISGANGGGIASGVFTAGKGSSVAITLGNGGAGTGSAGEDGGIGGTWTVTSGSGGNGGTGSTASTGGNGSIVSFVGAAGGVGGGSGTSMPGGTGSAFSISTGNGGVGGANSGSNGAAGGPGGAITLTSGNGATGGANGTGNTTGGNGGNGANINLTSGNGANGSNSSGSGANTNGGNSGTLAFQTGTAGNAGTGGSGASGIAGGVGPLTLQATRGNVGIGSASPGALLDVSGTVRIVGTNPLILVNGNIGIGTSTPQTSLAITNGNVGIGTWTAAGGALIVLGGNVGIGSATPGTQLDINGTMRMIGTGAGGFRVQAAANQACTTTCTTGKALFGFDDGTLGVTLPHLVGPTDATAEECLCGS